MNRRKFLIGTGLSLASLGVATYSWTQLSSASDKLTVDFALELLESIDTSKAKTTGEWGLIHVFDHCSKSLEYSMIGFPEHKSDAFQSTIGTTAFSIFKANGAMNHDLAEEIPSATYPSPSATLDQAISQLKWQFIQFSEYSGKLEEHFAYGSLNKRDYEIAHVMHLLDHWSEIQS